MDVRKSEYWETVVIAFVVGLALLAVDYYLGLVP
jgi:uncharacterized membrane-anchored protein YhcB (DUF1043 family)